MGVEIQIEGLTKSFGKQLIWGDVTLTVPAGEICVMLGPSGTGKSVLLKTLIGLLKPDRGSVVIEGVDITTCPERRRRTFPSRSASGCKAEAADSSEAGRVGNKLMSKR